MAEWTELPAKTIEQKIEKLKENYKQNKRTGHYTKEYLAENLEKDFNELKDEIQAAFKGEIAGTRIRLNELDGQNKRILPKSTSIDELLRRQEIEIEVNLMTDEDFEEYSRETLLNDHDYFEEIRLFSELRKRGKDDVELKIKDIREQRLLNNDEYTKLNHRATMLQALVNFSNEIAYEDDNGTVHYLDIDKLTEEVSEG